MSCWQESNTGMLALRCSCWPGLAGDLSLGSAELVTFLTVVKNRRKDSLKENQFILLHGLRGGRGGGVGVGGQSSRWGTQGGRSMVH